MKEKIEIIVAIFGPLLTVSAILIGIWQFNKGQANLQKIELEQRKHELEKMQIGNQFEAIAKFKELQAIKYKDATETISNIIHTDDYHSAEFKKYLKRFWQLYWVELSAVEDAEVESAMVKLGEHLNIIEAKGFENISAGEIEKLKTLGYRVAQAIKSSSKNWELPQKN